MRGEPDHRPPRDCPVCGHELQVTRLSCGSCGTELSGVFASCPFCALTDADRELLKVFLVSRGNMREVTKHLGVSYPTAGRRYTDLMLKLGFEGGADGEAAPTRDDVLRRLAAGTISVEDAEVLLLGSRD